MVDKMNTKMDEPKMIVFATDVEESMAEAFDLIARKNHRSRAAHLKFVVEQEILRHEEHLNSL